MSPVVLALLLPLAQATAAESIRPKAPPGTSWEEAEALAATVEAVERRVKAGKPGSAKPITVSERQFNSYVQLKLAPELPPGLSELSFRFEPDRLHATGMVDLDAVRQQLPNAGSGSLLSFVTGTVPVSLRGRFQGARGEGKVEVEEAVIAGFNLPPSLVAQLVAQSTRSAKRPAGFDLLSPFPLPWTADHVRLEQGRAVVEFAQKAAKKAP
jgi:hypothetical protein